MGIMEGHGSAVGSSDLVPVSIGNDDVRAACLHAIEQDRLPGTLLIAGPEHVGKTHLVRELIPHLVDVASWHGPLEEHPDVWWDDSEETFSIGRVKELRGKEEPSLREFLSLAPYGKQHRIAVIGQAQRMTVDASNALLKILEEPPERTHIVLTVPNEEMVPSTVKSRAMVMHAVLVPTGDIAAWLVKEHSIDEKLALQYARHAEGRPGRALRYVENPGVLAAEDEWATLLFDHAGEGLLGGLKLAGAIVQQSASARDRAREALRVWESLLSDVALLQTGRDERCIWAEHAGELSSWAAALPAASVVRHLSAVREGRSTLEQYAQPKLVMDGVIFSLFASDHPLPAVR